MLHEFSSDFFNPHRARFVIRLVGVGVERRVSELVGALIVHGKENLVGLHVGGDESDGGDAALSGGDLNRGICMEAQLRGIVGMEFQ